MLNYVQWRSVHNLLIRTLSPNHPQTDNQIAATVYVKDAKYIGYLKTAMIVFLFNYTMLKNMYRKQNKRGSKFYTRHPESSLCSWYQ